MTVDQIVTIYQLRKQGKSIAEVSRTVGKPIGSVSAIYHYTQSAMGEIKKAKHTSKRFYEAAKLIKQPLPKPALPVYTTSPLSQLESAKSLLDEAIFNLIKSEVERQVKDIKAENKRLKAEIEELKVFKDQAKHSNLYTNLRKHFGMQA